MVQVAYRTVRSRRKFVRSPEIKKAMADWLDDAAKPHLIERFEFVVANWKTNVTFKARKFIRADSISINVFPDQGKEIWGYVVEGTKPHVIRPRHGKALSFKWGGPGSYRPKTRPPAKFGGPGATSGKSVAFPVVNHPGTEERPFPKEIAKDEKRWFSRNAENAWRRAFRLV